MTYSETIPNFTPQDDDPLADIWRAASAEWGLHPERITSVSLEIAPTAADSLDSRVYYRSAEADPQMLIVPAALARYALGLKDAIHLPSHSRVHALSMTAIEL